MTVEDPCLAVNLTQEIPVFLTSWVLQAVLPCAGDVTGV